MEFLKGPLLQSQPPFHLNFESRPPVLLTCTSGSSDKFQPLPFDQCSDLFIQHCSYENLEEKKSILSINFTEPCDFG